MTECPVYIEAAIPSMLYPITYVETIAHGIVTSNVNDSSTFVERLYIAKALFREDAAVDIDMIGSHITIYGIISSIIPSNVSSSVTKSTIQFLKINSRAQQEADDKHVIHIEMEATFFAT
mmetsp:Transcript_27157/g.40842  ORF Transcript_27157/g.40842 Transcript_27157/m.40842 type:complete len:120 (-) Transcript_27157:1742-2101(-)